MKKLYHKYARTIRKNCLSKDKFPVKDVTYWQNYLFARTLEMSIPLSLITLIPGFWVSLLQELYALAIFDVVSFIVIIYIGFGKRMDIEVRKKLLILNTYLIASFLLFYIGVQGPGLLFLYAAIIFGLLILPNKFAFVLSTINIIIVILFAFVIHFNLSPIQMVNDLSVSEWFAISANLIFLSLLSSILIPKLFKGLSDTFVNQGALQEQLTIKGNEQESLLEELNRLFHQMRNSEKQYRTLVSESPIGIVLVEKYSGLIIECNDTFAQMIGYNKEELIHQKADLYFEEIINDGTKQEIYSSINGNGNKQVIEATCLHKNKNKIYTEISISNVMYGDALSVNMMNFLDVTHRKKIEIANSIAYSISAKASDKELFTKDFCVFIKDQIGLALDTSEFYIVQETEEKKLTYHYVKDEIFEENLPFTAPFANGLCEFIIEKGNSLLLYGNEIQEFYQKNSIQLFNKTPKSLIGAPILAKGKSIGAIICKSYDKQDLYDQDHVKLLTLVGSHLGVFFERINFDTKIRQSEERFRGLIEHSSEITCVLNKEGVISYISPSSIQVFGYCPEELQNTSIFKYIHKEDLKAAQLGLQKELDFKSDGTYTIYKIVHKNNTIKYIRAIISNQLNNSSINGLIINAQDVTEMEKVQFELRRQHRKALEYQSMLLSSQLNPHFIFNSLNSIQYFILEQNPLPALNYLSNFAKLMRLVLDNSTKKFITLAEEINFLNIYLELEEDRHRGKFMHSIYVHKNVDPTEVMIPPMLLQPYIENTVIHGVGYLPSDGKIFIKFIKVDNMVHCTIRDNGVGRQKANEFKKMRSGETHNSFSTKINNSRLTILNTLGDDKYSGTIEDLILEDGQPSGTKVEVVFPYIVDDE
jgi:PAS domain S-box-containing protein